MGAIPTEIRIHGVSGTPPQDMLGVSAPAGLERVTSYVDPRTGFYRAKPSSTQPDAEVEVEAYSWGSLTSGGVGLVEPVKRAAWLALLPFALANVAYWARVDIDKERRTGRAAGRVRTAVAIRWAGLLLTMALVSATCLVGIDLVAWQCFRGGGHVCASPDRLIGLDVLGFLGEPAWNSLGRRVAVAAIIPIAVLLGLLLLSSQAKARYEAVPDEPASGQADLDSQADLDGSMPILRRALMWQGARRLSLQQVLHLAVGLAVVALYGAVPLLEALTPATRTQPASVWLQVASGLAGGALIVAFAGSGFSVRDGVDFNGPNPRLFWARRCGWGALVLALLAVVAFAVPAGWLLDADGVDESRGMSSGGLLIGLVFLALILIVSWLVFAGRDWRLSLLAAASVLGLTGVSLGARTVAGWVPAATGAVAVVVLVLLGQRLHARTRSAEDAWGGAAAAMTLGAATWVAMIFTVVLVVGVANVLNGDESVTDLASTFDPERSAGQASIDLGRDASEVEALTAQGPVAVRDAVLFRDAASGEWTVLRGVVETPGLTASFGDPAIERGLSEVTLAGGRLTLKEPRITLIDSCRADDVQSATRMSPAPGCPVAGAGGAEGRFVHRGVLPTGLTIGLGAGGDPVDGPWVHITVDDRPQEVLVLPSVLLWVTSVLPFWVVALLMSALVLVRRFRGRATAQIRFVAKADGIDDADLQRCTRARRRAALAHRLERLTGLFATATVLAVLVIIVGSATGEAPWDRFEPLRPLGDLGLFLAVAVATAIVWIVSRVRKDEAGRRRAGILWDLTTFWPRMAHPLGPPCYAERVVPEVTRRVRAVNRDQAGLVILSGHSMGSVIGAAVATRLSDAELARVRVITYGSQLSAWFGRIFPAVIGPDILGTVRQERAWDFAGASPDAPTTHGHPPEAPPLTLRGRLGPHHWVNLFRRTDPLGFRLFSESDSALDRYVGELDAKHDLMTHSGYQFSPEYEAAIHEWVSAATGPVPVGRDAG